MSRSRPHERHIFPPDDGPNHKPSAWCSCKPSKRIHGFSTVYVHSLIGPGVTMKQEEPRGPGDDGTFTVVMMDVLRNRFERWLRREHLQMGPLPGGGPHHFQVLPPPAGGHWDG